MATQSEIQRFANFLKKTVNYQFEEANDENGQRVFYWAKSQIPATRIESMEKELTEAGLEFISSSKMLVVVASENNMAVMNGDKTKEQTDIAPPDIKETSAPLPAEKDSRTQKMNEFLAQLTLDIKSKEIDLFQAAGASTLLAIPRNKDYVYYLGRYFSLNTNETCHTFNKYKLTQSEYHPGEDLLSDESISATLSEKPYFDTLKSIYDALEASIPQEGFTFIPEKYSDIIYKILKAKRIGKVNLLEILNKTRADWEQQLQHEEEIRQSYQNMPYAEFTAKLKSELKSRKSEIWVTEYVPSSINIYFAGDDRSYQIYDIDKDGKYVTEIRNDHGGAHTLKK